MQLSQLPAWLEDMVDRSDDATTWLCGHDPLVIAACAHRYQQTHHCFPPSVDVLEFIMADYILADQMRSYYSAKLVELSLNGQSLSEFRKKLASIINGRTLLEKSEVGLLYKLAGFYFEDIAIDEVFNRTTPIPGDMRDQRLPQIDKVVTLNPLRKVVHSRSVHGRIVKYWFSDQHNHACCVTSLEKNIFVPLMDDLCRRPKLNLVTSINLSHTVGDPKTRGPRWYWNLFNFRLSQDL